MNTTQKNILACLFAAIAALLLGVTLGHSVAWAATIGWLLALAFFIGAAAFWAKGTQHKQHQ
ncbi:hypothetical protein ACUY3K_04760 [Corynebacterium uberis]|uniref:hypothetical protein n=1 Tax=Corynebacterium TaxID=1716 RepID=UPI001D0A0D74|nr:MULTISPECIES: hypothetical protein [Corynebacterium]MCZ9310031.1 hypothetical protein [Corynebacterium sp. c6VSa_13]UDL73781.1 hypothetical protein LH391_00655 [Corynebacterium uberis]UDL75336.1 hypothetical protein LH393_08755 [Corynebacterium uberis]UDL77547.1 hypothetical protein LH394_08735 [Corynebacterium uberis]UDL79834.1 hypothetical protein LH392_09170 [Corynebacterium uberis]